MKWEALHELIFTAGINVGFHSFTHPFYGLEKKNIEFYVRKPIVNKICKIRKFYGKKLKGEERGSLTAVGLDFCREIFTTDYGCVPHINVTANLCKQQLQVLSAII